MPTATIDVEVIDGVAPRLVRVAIPAGEVELTSEAVAALCLRLKLAEVQAKRPGPAIRQGRLPYRDD